MSTRQLLAQMAVAVVVAVVGALLLTTAFGLTGPSAWLLAGLWGAFTGLAVPAVMAEVVGR